MSTCRRWPNARHPGPPLHTLTQIVPDASVSSSEAFAGWLVDASEGILRRFRGGPNPSLSPPIETGGAAHLAVHDGSNLWVGQGQELVKLVRNKVASRTRLPGTPVAIAALTAAYGSRRPRNDSCCSAVTEAGSAYFEPRETP